MSARRRSAKVGEDTRIPFEVDVRTIRRKLLRWYDRSHRDLPWRRTRDPYAIWVSEIMLQQTRVEAVIPYYERFLARFPTVETLASSREDDVLALWSGLGYYRRARQLREAAGTVVRDHGGRFPPCLEDARSLPGIGRYTAGAVLSIAYGLSHPVLDGNVARILSRVLRLGEGTTERTLWDVAGRLVPRGRPGDFNQAMMELGATVCTPRAPDCPRCPLAAVCGAADQGDPESFPARRPASRPIRTPVAIALARRNGRLLLCRRRDRTVLRGLWEFPDCEPRRGVGAAGALAQAFQKDFGLRLLVGEPIGSVRHAIMNRKLEITVFEARVEGRPRRSTAAGELRWLFPGSLRAYPLTGVTRKVLRRFVEGWPG